MNVTINGKKQQLSSSIITIQGLVEWLELEPTGVAVAVNLEVISKINWLSTPLKDGDVIDIIQARQGG